MIVPALATLLPSPPGQVLGHERPAARAVHANQMPHQAVLLLCPLLALRARLLAIGARLQALGTRLGFRGRRGHLHAFLFTRGARTVPRATCGCALCSAHSLAREFESGGRQVT